MGCPIPCRVLRGKGWGFLTSNFAHCSAGILDLALRLPGHDPTRLCITKYLTPAASPATLSPCSTRGLIAFGASVAPLPPLRRRAPPPKSSQTSASFATPWSAPPPSPPSPVGDKFFSAPPPSLPP